MRRLVPYPVLSLGLFGASLLLSASVAPPSLLLALLLALLAPIIMLALGVDRVRLNSPKALVSLAVDVVADVVRSNWAVSQIILGRRRHERTSGFIHVPLDLRDRYGLAVLAIIITSTPGTLWVEYESATGSLLLHVLDLVDEETWVRTIKDRYERRLMEIFE
ncbi:putative monovalent cation/H+ antiporter subunit E [Brevundimonas sp. SH203]|uniref:Na+/H+ antiporter subunit E n=1 Tax=Brevundimonas sp. SH203 TaxID=345167 RepID=UPI0009CC8A4B|nr:Na+/H+ antiporter subunit E [Brevundimonas sp. SH203]GAW40830.1 putative monovalent cation/H+ antiporter subunit E [Brevundimonas sp. SH203]